MNSTSRANFLRKINQPYAYENGLTISRYERLVNSILNEKNVILNLTEKDVQDVVKYLTIIDINKIINDLKNSIIQSYKADIDSASLKASARKAFEKNVSKADIELELEISKNNAYKVCDDNINKLKEFISKIKLRKPDIDSFFE